MSFHKLSEFPQSAERDFLMQCEKDGWPIYRQSLPPNQKGILVSANSVVIFGLAKRVLELQKRIEDLEATRKET